MKQAYLDINLRGETLKMIQFINQLIESYMAQGYTLSVRQLYYQLVARDLIPNNERSYKRVASIINDGRLAGLIDWEAIEDRNRDVEMRTRWSSASSIIDACVSSFHMDMWDNQEHRVFVIVEKAALAGVLEPICRKYDVPLLAARGYPSVSIVREMVLEHMTSAMDYQQSIVLHLGDHDPSGIDMTRDLKERISMFAAPYPGYMPEVKRIALTMKQIEEVRPPPNPAKTSDARFDSYMREFGDESWELDALDPAYITRLVAGHITSFINDDLWAEREALVEEKRNRLKKTQQQYEKEFV